MIISCELRFLLMAILSLFLNNLYSQCFLIPSVISLGYHKFSDAFRENIYVSPKLEQFTWVTFILSASDSFVLPSIILFSFVVVFLLHYYKCRGNRISWGSSGDHIETRC